MFAQNVTNMEQTIKKLPYFFLPHKKAQQLFN
jgi:hypothetical protein